MAMWEQKKIKVPLFPCVLYIILTNDLERVKKEFPDCYFDEVYATSVWGKTDAVSYTHLTLPTKA